MPPGALRGRGKVSILSIRERVRVKDLGAEILKSG